MIKRYNQGFGGFGPLEQCFDGKLMKSEEVLKELIQLTDSLNDSEERAAKYLNSKDNYYKENCILLQQKLNDTKYIIVLQNALFFASASIMAAILIGIYEWL